MLSNRTVKIFTVFVLAFSVIFNCTVFSYAYSPIVTVESDDWIINSDSTYRAVYPERIDSNYAPADIVYSVSELNGYTYYGSRFGEDFDMELTYTTKLPKNNITIDDTDFVFVFQINSVVWMFVCSSNNITLAYSPVFDSSGNFVKYNFVYRLTEACKVSLYSCPYPYENWKYQESSTHSSSDLNKNIVRNWFASAGDDVLNPLWVSQGEVYRYDVSSSTIDNMDIMFMTSGYSDISLLYAKEFTLSFERYFYILAGACDEVLSIDDVRFLSSGDCCIRINDFGFICGTESTLAHANYELAVYSYPSMELQDTIVLFDSDLYFDTSDYVNSEYSTYDLKAGDYSFHDILSFQFFDFPFDDNPQTTDYIVQLRYMFVSDGFNLFFPGTFEIIEFEDYEDDMQHNEVVDSIKDASDSINGTINSIGSDLGKEIASAATSISSSINENVNIKFDELLYGDTGYDEPDFDTESIDSISGQTDSTIDSIIESLNSDISSYLPSGYVSFEAYFTSTVNTIDSQFSYAFLAVRNVFDKLVSVTDISVVLLFSLIFGFGMFVIGRNLQRD